ncbi:YfhO family protein [Candidatus Gottesmanbacteria bacterium]|nr:YfhO family protein [Candidatus Gottesmanbacteria bacterium]
MKKIILPIVLYAAIVFLVFGKALFPGPQQLIYGDDIHHQYYFYREFFNSFLKQGIFPWWNPYNFSGTPFIANPVVNIWYPPTWFFTLLPLNVAFSWHLALHIVWAMLGMYVFLRYLSSRPLSRDPMHKLLDSSFRWNDIGPWVGGLIFGLSGFFMARVWAGHVDVIAAASWMPWVVWSDVRCQMSEIGWRKNCIVAAGVLAMQLLAGYQTMAIFTLEIVVLLTIFLCVLQRSATPAIRAIFAVFGGIGLAAIQLVPLYAFLSQSIRTIPKPYEWASYGAMSWQSLTQFIQPFFFGDQYTYHGPPPNFAEHAAFVGRVGLGLAIFACLAFLRKSRWVLFFAIIAFFGLWVSLGPNAPIDVQKILWTIVPVYQSLRFPSRHLILFVFGAAGLAAYGMRLLKGRALGIVIACFVTVEMVGFARHFIELRPIPETRQDSELVALLKGDTQPYRLLQNFGAWISQREALEFDATMSHRIFSATGYDVAILKGYYEFIDAAAGNKTSSILTHDVQVPYFNGYSKALDTLNIKYIMVPRSYDPFVSLKLIREDPIRDYRLYENTSVLPRFYFPDHTAPTITKYTPNEIVLTSNYPSDATLMSSEVFYPEWQAFIDGKKTDIIKGNYAFRTLFVPAGKQSVVFRYVPTFFLIGLAISVATAMVLVITNIF